MKRAPLHPEDFVDAFHAYALKVLNNDFQDDFKDGLRKLFDEAQYLKAYLVDRNHAEEQIDKLLSPFFTEVADPKAATEAFDKAEAVLEAFSKKWPYTPDGKEVELQVMIHFERPYYTGELKEVEEFYKKRKEKYEL